MRIEIDRSKLAGLATTDEAKQFLEDIADEVLEAARQIAPVQTGYYRRSLRKGTVTESDGNLTVQVGSTDPFGHIVEFGSVNSTAYAPLRRAAERAGLDLERTAR